MFDHLIMTLTFHAEIGLTIKAKTRMSFAGKKAQLIDALKRSRTSRLPKS